jgi:hypothetical protein
MGKTNRGTFQTFPRHPVTMESEIMGCETCRKLLNEALNLAVRSDQFDEQARREAALDASQCPDEWQESGRFDAYVERHNATTPHRRIATKSMTMHLWVQDQYDKDLADWKGRARRHLTEGCHPHPATL